MNMNKEICKFETLSVCIYEYIIAENTHKERISNLFGHLLRCYDRRIDTITISLHPSHIHMNMDCERHMWYFNYHKTIQIGLDGPLLVTMVMKERKIKIAKYGKTNNRTDLVN